MKKAAVLWTGGKDSALALFESMGDFHIECLVTFVPTSGKNFVAHPLALMQLQAESIGLEHRCVPITEPFEKGYVDAIAALADSGIEVLITGDISLVNNQPNWIRQCAAGLVETHMPLWEQPRDVLLGKLVENSFEVICTLAYKQHFRNTIVGKMLDRGLVRKLLDKEHVAGIDPCGENGEYHTSVLSAPYFSHAIDLKGKRVVEADEYYHLVFDDISLSNM